MRKGAFPLYIGIASMLLAVLAFFPKVIIVMGAIVGLWGIIITTNDLKRNRHDKNLLRLSQFICGLATAACVFILIYF